MDFIVEKLVLPVHSIFFYQSSILWGCFTDTVNLSRPQIEACFSKYKAEDVDAFLCQLYPTADPDKSVFRCYCYEIMEIAVHLECQSVVESAITYMEEVPSILAKEFEDIQHSRMEKWFLMAKRISSPKLDKLLATILCESFDKMQGSFSSNQLASILSCIPGESVLQLVMSKDNQLKKRVELRLEHNASCASCENENYKRVKTWAFKKSEYVPPLTWSCPKCKDKFRLSFCGLM